MSESSLDEPCPGCGAPTPRAYLTPVGLACMPAAERIARATNERGAHAPLTTAQHNEKTAARKHRAGCACCSSKPLSKTTVRGKDGPKSFPSKRPWSISH
jgi:hypothetical protein